MKYIRTYEKVISVEIDEKWQRLLFIQAIEDKDLDLVDSLLKGGVDPNTENDYKTPVLIISALPRDKKPNLDIIRLLIKYGASLNDKEDGSPVINRLLYQISKSSNQNTLLSVLSIFLDQDVDLFYETEKVYRNQDRDDFFGILKSKLDYEDVRPSLYKKILELVKQKKPEQYEKFMMEESAKKYNL